MPCQDSGKKTVSSSSKGRKNIVLVEVDRGNHLREKNSLACMTTLTLRKITKGSLQEKDFNSETAAQR